MPMKKFLDRLNTITFTPRSTVWFLLIIAALTYGLFFWQRGFYWDEFPWAWIYYRLGPAMLTKTFTTSRPFWGMIYQLTLPVIGPNPWVWQLLAILLRWLTAVLLWKILRVLYPAHPKPALWASLFFLVYPGMGQHFIAMMYSHFYIVLAAYLLSVYLSILALKEEKQRWLYFSVSYALAAVNLLTMEYFYFLEFARLFIFLQILPGGFKERAKKALLYSLPYLGIFAAVTFWRMFFFAYQNASYPYVLLDKLKANLFDGILYFLNQILLSFWRTVFEAWILPFLTIGMTGFGPLTLTLMLFLLFSTIFLTGFYLFAFKAEDADGVDFTKQAGWIGLVFWVLSGGSVWLIGIVPQFNFSMDRFMLPFMLGSSVLLACLAALIKNPRVQMIVVALLIGFAGSRHFRLEEAYRSDWITQKEFFWQMTERIPGLTKGTIVLANDLPVTYFSDNSLTGPFNWIYSPPGEMNVMLYFASIRVGKTLPSVEPGQPHELYYIGPMFYGNTSNILVVNYEPPGCFRVIDPEVEAENRLLPPAVRDAARYSNPGVILFEKQNQLPGPFYGSGPEKDWCYYFEQADLARQKKDWESVVRLGDAAFALGDHPNDPLERFVYIEGYAHLGEWKKAVELSQASYKVSRNFVGPLLCRLWDRIERETENTPEQTAALVEVRSEFGCAP
ncbi:MAG: hypothetical protein DPW18_03465 [Chloroflexi bacterium]|nr:hypothetical protein [Chloroflexota bacterium]MDL1943134.1 glycosyltransferase family 39 protein [Chloroflexi bacterium CFX2]